MKNKFRIYLIFSAQLFLFTVVCIATNLKNGLSGEVNSDSSPRYPNLFVELLGKNPIDVQKKIEDAYSQLYYGDSSMQRIFYPVGTEMAYIEDMLNKDVRTEGMSYGMMIAVQLDKKRDFDKLWKWAKTFMQHKHGQRENYFAWHCAPSGVKLDSNSASDGEEWFVTALFFASARWGDGSGIYNYRVEAQNILDAMLTKADTSDRKDIVTNMFNRREKQVVFVPAGEADDFTDPSYHVPHFYTLWSRWADKENQFWLDAADASRKFLRKVTNPVTGLAPDYAKFDGTPFSPWGGGNENFQYDAWRVAMNVAIDQIWFGKNPWAQEHSSRLLSFFHSQGLAHYGNLFTLDGKRLGTDHSAGLVAMNAVAALTSTLEIRKEFVQELWNLPIPDGNARYYDGMLYLLGMLQVSGNFKLYEPLPAVHKN
jgi:oligosaccharide reducing-end xylanase